MLRERTKALADPTKQTYTSVWEWDKLLLIDQKDQKTDQRTERSTTPRLNPIDKSHELPISPNIIPFERHTYLHPTRKMNVSASIDRDRKLYQ